MKLQTSQLFFPIPLTTPLSYSCTKRTSLSSLNLLNKHTFFSFQVLPDSVLRDILQNPNRHGKHRVLQENLRQNVMTSELVLALMSKYLAWVWSWLWLSTSTKLILSVHHHHLSKVKDQFGITPFTLLPMPTPVFTVFFPTRLTSNYWCLLNVLNYMKISEPWSVSPLSKEMNIDKRI